MINNSKEEFEKIKRVLLDANVIDETSLEELLKDASKSQEEDLQQKLDQLKGEISLQKAQNGATKEPDWYYQYADYQKSQPKKSIRQSNTGIGQLGKYQLTKELGKGGFGVVYHGIHVDTWEEVAIKVLLDNTKQQNVDYFFREISSMVSCEHQTIVSLLGFGRQGNVPYLVMEYMRGGTLNDYYSYLIDVVEKMRQICPAVEHIHDQGIIHRDLKVENFLQTKKDGKEHQENKSSQDTPGPSNPDGTNKNLEIPKIKISDFGLAAKVNTEEAKEFAGTKEYIAPEVWYSELSRKYKARIYAGPESDVYTLALTPLNWQIKAWI